MLCFRCERLLELRDELIVSRLLRQLDQQLPGGVVSEFGGEQGLETLRQCGARIRQNLNQAHCGDCADIGTGGLRGGVPTHLGDDLRQHLEVLELFFHDVVQVSQQGGTVVVSTGLHLADHGLVKAYAAALVGCSFSQLIEENFRVITLEFALGRFHQAFARGRYGNRADPQCFGNVIASCCRDVQLTATGRMGRPLVCILYLRGALLGGHLHACAIHPHFGLVFHLSSFRPLRLNGGSVHHRATTDNRQTRYWSEKSLHSQWRGTPWTARLPALWVQSLGRWRADRLPFPALHARTPAAALSSACRACRLPRPQPGRGAHTS